jgi:hypothetical protein
MPAPAPPYQNGRAVTFLTMPAPAPVYQMAAP